MRQLWRNKAGALSLLALVAGCADAPAARPGPNGGADAAATDAAAGDVAACTDRTSCEALLGPLVAQPCKLDGALPGNAGIALVPRFPKLKLAQPLQILPWPGEQDALVAVLRAGKLVRFANTDDATSADVLVDLTSQVSTAGEGGLLSAAFHPQFAKNRKVYVDWTAQKPEFATVITELTLDENGQAIAALTRELFRLKQPWANHNGGQLAFDLSGKLLIGLGDGGSGGDPLNAGQDKQTLLGKILRLDVDAAGPDKPYAIPADNPFVDDKGFLPEIWAWGLRNPWRFSVDAVTGAVWIADVGQNAWEEVDIAFGGENFGWKVMEAGHCFAAKTCDQSGLTMPVAEYGRDEGASITGGVVYRGNQQLSLYGKYLFADYVSGRFWTLSAKEAQPGTWQRTLVAETNLQPVGFGQDRHGEVFVTQLFGASTVFQVVEKPAQAPPQGEAFPQLLSQTGCFASLQPLTPAPGLYPYQPHAPLWSDGAHKQRWLGLPVAPNPGQPGPIQLPVRSDASWQLPRGSVLVKHFALPGAAGDVPVETRIMHLRPDGWHFYSWHWPDGGNDAIWRPGGGGSRVVELGNGKTQTWDYPTTAQCRQCHTAAGGESGQVLGLQSDQLAGPFAFGSKSAPYVATLNAAGFFATAQTEADAKPMPVVAEVAAGESGPDAADPSAAARALLHSNCAPCHRPGGGAPSDMDLRWQTESAAMGIWNAPPQSGDLDGQASAIAVPGNPQASALWLRVHAPPGSPLAMPPLGTRIASEQLRKLVGEWIAAGQ